MSRYAVPAGAAAAELRERGSRFLAWVEPAADEPGIRARIAELVRLHPDATHHCWAWRLGAAPRERASDAGEPAGTAGQPMLQVLRGSGLSDVLAVVARWYGGTKLGRGGLARAYAGVTREAVALLPRGEKLAAVDLLCTLPYERLGALKRLVRPPQVEIAQATYGAAVELVLRVEEELGGEVAAALADLGIVARPGSSHEE